MSTDRLSPEPEPGDPTSEPGDADRAGESTPGRAPGGRTYDDETPAAEVEATRGADRGEADTEGATGLTGLDVADPGRHQV